MIGNDIDGINLSIATLRTKYEQGIKGLEDLYKRRYALSKDGVNAKLYEVASHEFMDGSKRSEDAFTSFCDEHWELFNEDMIAPNNLKLDFIGSTSTFYIVHEHENRQLFETEDAPAYIAWLSETYDLPESLLEHNFENAVSVIKRQSFTSNVLETGIDAIDFANGEASKIVAICEKIDDLDLLSEIVDQLREFEEQLNDEIEDYSYYDSTKKEVEEIMVDIASAYEYLDAFKKNQLKYWEDHISHLDEIYSERGL